MKRGGHDGDVMAVMCVFNGQVHSGEAEGLQYSCSTLEVKFSR